MWCWNNNKLKYIAWFCGSSSQFVWVWKRGGLEKQTPVTVAAALWTGTSGARVCRSDEKHCQSGNRSPVNVSVWSDFYSGTGVTGCLWKRFHMMGNPRGTVTQLSFDIRFMKKLLL